MLPTGSDALSEAYVTISYCYALPRKEKNVKTIKKIQSGVAKGSLILAAVILGAVSCALFANVLCRYVFEIGMMWVEMFARYGLIWSVFLASNVLIYRNELMRVDFLDSFWPKKFVKIREILYTVIFLAMLIILVWQGWVQAESFIGVAVMGLPIDKFWIYLSIPVGAGLMLFQYLCNLLNNLLYKSDRIEEGGNK